MEENNQVTQETEQQTYSYAYDQSYSQLEPQKKGNAILGTVGAIGGALIGAALWVIIYQVGFIAGIAGFVTVLCAIKGFELLGKQKAGKLGTILCVLISLIIIFMANYFCYAIEVYKAFGTDYYLTFGDSLALVPEILQDGEVMGAFLKDLLIGYALTIVASFSAIGAAFKKQ